MAAVRNSVRIRRTYNKLMLTVSIGTLQNGVGLTQTFDGSAYSPDHSVTALALMPIITAKASDIPSAQSWAVGEDESTSGNANLAWRVNGAAINTVWTEGTDYEFGDNGKVLYVKRNVLTSESFDITCKVLVLDSRTGIVIPITSESTKLSTVSTSQAATTLRLSQNNIVWDVMADDLWEWEYRAARGLPQKMTLAQATNDACYKKSVDICVAKGSQGQLSTGFGLKVTDSANVVVATMTAAGVVTINDRLRINSLSRTKIEFDCRTIQRERFTIQATDGSNAVIVTAKDAVEVVAKHRDFDTPVIENTSDYTAKNTVYHNSVKVSSNGEELDYPECFLYIDFFTKSYEAGASERYVGSGNECWFNPNESGNGLTPSDNGFDMIAEADYHALLQETLDDNNTDELTDENGEILLT